MHIHIFYINIIGLGPSNNHLENSFFRNEVSVRCSRSLSENYL